RAVSMTTTRDGGLVYGAGNDWDATASRTPAEGQAIVLDALPPAGTFWVQNIVGPIESAGTVVALSDTDPTTDRWNLAAVEILPRPQRVFPATQSATPLTTTSAVLHV